MSSTHFLENLSGAEFENLIEELVQKMGFITKTRTRGADGGIDIHAVNNQPILQGDYIIQCKRYSNPVGVAIVRDLYGVVHSRNANKGIIITNSYFTKPALDFVKDKQLELINGDKLVQLLAQSNLLPKEENNNQKITFNISNAIRTLEISLIKKIQQQHNKIMDHKNGLVYVNKRDIDQKKWLDHIISETQKMQDYTNVIKNLINQIMLHLDSNDQDNVQIIQTYSTKIINANEILTKNYFKTLALRPPEIWTKAYEAWLDVYVSYFDAWNDWAASFTKSIENPPKDGQIELMLAFGDEAINRYNQEFKKVENLLNSQKTGCFIVTAAYNSPMAKEVDIFRNFRDSFLNQNVIGKTLIHFYYENSPFYANLINRSNLMKQIVRQYLLHPILLWLKKNNYEY
ncbi:MAG: restriction endonuclease [Candidatus Bathyarchaeota archaeon]|nr:restriction endonuclease [Candidatus Bathyarchaeota archaeon]